MYITENARILATRGNKTVYKTSEYVIKVFNDQKPASDVFNEALNLARINDTDILAPQCLGVVLEEGSWILLTQRIDGHPFADLTDGVNPDFQDSLDRFVAIQKSIHENRAPLLNRQKDKFARMIKSLDLDETVRYNLLCRLDGMKVDECVCHGDFIPENIIETSDGAYICDWAHATKGDPATDVAMTYLLFYINVSEDVAKAYLTCYCAHTHVSMKDVYDWLPIVAAAELARGHKEHEAILKHWLDVTDWQ